VTDQEKFLLELLEEMSRDRAWELVSDALDQLGGVSWLKEMDAILKTYPVIAGAGRVLSGNSNDAVMQHYDSKSRAFLKACSAPDCTVIRSGNRGRDDQSVFKTLMIAFGVVMIQVFRHGTA